MNFNPDLRSLKDVTIGIRVDENDDSIKRLTLTLPRTPNDSRPYKASKEVGDKARIFDIACLGVPIGDSASPRIRVLLTGLVL